MGEQMRQNDLSGLFSLPRFDFPLMLGSRWPKLIEPLYPHIRCPADPRPSEKLAKRTPYPSSSQTKGDDDVLSPTEIRQQITNQIIDALTNRNLPPWRRPWSDDPNAGVHTSLSTGNSYKGINQLLLQIAASHHGFQSRWWGTFNQVKNSGAHVLKAEKGTHVVLFKPIKRTRIDEKGDETDDSFLVMRTFTVFNAEQTSGLDQYRVGFAQPKQDTTDRYEHADAVIEATGADIRYGGNEAFYRSGEDFIQVPFSHQFESAEAFYETMFHELCHWTEQRVGFDRSKPENSYALGELVAEIGSCFMMAELGLPTTTNMTNHAAYLESWLKGMNGDPKFIFRASAQASKAVEFVMSFSRDRVEVVGQTDDGIPF
jgi:antirestriction protein ArdC